MNFRSDNTHGATAKVMQAVVRANEGTADAYGGDALTARAENRIREVLEAPDAAVLLVATGTAANALGLSLMAPPFGAVLCHPGAHINVDECGAPEFYTGGAKLVPVADEAGRITPAGVAEAFDDRFDSVHQVQPAAVSITQATETGRVYGPDDVAAIAEAARARGLGLHMDGARLGNAVAALGCTPAETTWKAGVDVLSFGATKNGCLGVEAIVVFDPARAETLAFLRKRAGHLFSKMRYLAAQMDAYLEDGHWLENARHANAMARRLADGLASVPGAEFRYPVEANELFVELPAPVVRALEDAGYGVYRWKDDAARPLLRFVTAFDTQAGDVDGLIETARRAAATA